MYNKNTIKLIIFMLYYFQQLISQLFFEQNVGGTL